MFVEVPIVSSKDFPTTAAVIRCEIGVSLR